MLYGCNNSTRTQGYYAPNRFTMGDGWFNLQPVFIEDKSSKECRYDNRANDKKCEGCKK